MVATIDTSAVKNSAAKPDLALRAAAALGMVSLMALGGCAGAFPYHYAPPPRTPQLSASTALSRPPASTPLPPPETAVQSSPYGPFVPVAARRISAPAPASRASAELPASGLPAEPSRPRYGAPVGKPASGLAGDPEVSGDAAVPSMLARMGAVAAPFSRPERQETRQETPAPLPASVPAPVPAPAPAPAPAAGFEPQAIGRDPIRTAARVGPVAPPFSGSMEPPERPAPPFASATGEREPLAALPEADDAQAFDAYAPAAPVQIDENEIEMVGLDADPAPYTFDIHGGRTRPLDHPMFRETAASLATVVVSTRGVQVMDDAVAAVVPAVTVLPVDRGEWIPVAAVTYGAAEPATPYGAVPQYSNDGTLIATLLFADGSVDVHDREREILNEVARIQKARGRPLTLIGHASRRTRSMDPVAHKEANLRISRERAEAVATVLREFGVAKSALRITPMADNQPLFSEVMPSGEAGNRRVEVYLGY